MTGNRFRALAAALVLVGGVLIGGTTLLYFQRPLPTIEHKPPATPIAPDLTWQLERLGGQRTSLADFREEVLFINNWATWCAPCIAEMPTIERLAQRFQDASVAFIVVSDESSDTVSPFVQEHRWQLPVYVTEARPESFQTEAIPSTFILDGARQVAFSHMGIADWDDGTADDLLQDLLDG